MARAFNQAQKFGAEFSIPAQVIGLEVRKGADENGFTLLLSTNERVNARSVVIASGVRYRLLGVENVSEFEGSSVHYWA